MITFENLSFSYGNTGEEQLNSLDLQIKKGEFVLLCGRSACGKTTATKCINGLIPHFTEGKYSGSVVVKEKEIAKTTASLEKGCGKKVYAISAVARKGLFECLLEVNKYIKRDRKQRSETVDEPAQNKTEKTWSPL